MFNARIMLGMFSAFLIGCDSEPKMPPLAEVEGVVLLAGRPLPNAQVLFTPTAPGLPSNAVASGTTDDSGRFKLATNGKPGAVTGDHIVTVIEGATPENLRDENAQDQAAKFQTRLKNRPIPAKYANITQSGLKVTVANDRKEYKIELSR